LGDDKLEFTGTSEGKAYELSIEFFKKVDSKGSTYNVLPRSVQMHVIKNEEDQDEFWPRLLKDKTLEKNQIKIDWDRYVDEDEEAEGFDTSALEGGMGMGGMPPGMGGGGMPPGMGGMGGGPGGGMGGMDMEALMKQMGGMGGMPGMGDMGGMPPGMGGQDMGGQDDGDDGDDGDDLDDLPDLEES
jgi:prostaglandin-E synthase